MHKVVFATNNIHKIAEVSDILCSEIKLLSLKDIGCFDELPETQNTIEANALQKARYVYEKFGMDCFADDTGLEVEILKGAPGVYSARYAGEDCNSENNIQKLLLKMDGETNRNACFRTVAALILDGKEYLFEGKISGRILTEKHGTDGFGYDPVFLPDGYDLSFAQMGMELKNRISHRALAMKKLSTFLNK
ncbi:MAG: non-canonical purine NTP diphosphatase [Bacteroidales bacterium]|nr:non-canonical purine NTP diphosphatase [Bacteroidales bacterium]MDD3907602.1 non-canonical purine NTP diphosphatase [Bacteroidales bacterium]